MPVSAATTAPARPQPSSTCIRQASTSCGSTPLPDCVHDLMVEALEEWGAKRGLAGPWRVEPTKPRR